jgi:hypothetical protein
MVKNKGLKTTIRLTMLFRSLECKEKIVVNGL